MSNPLQPKIAKVLEQEYNAFVVVIVAASKSGVMDIVASVPHMIDYRPLGLKPEEFMRANLGLFYGFEVKWKSDQPSELQKEKINSLIDKGGRGYFIRSVDQLRDILDKNIAPIKYQLKDRIRI